MSSDVGTLLLPKVRLFVRLICRSDPVGTVITTGDHVTVFGLAIAHVAVEPATNDPQLYPHIGTEEPSGKVNVDEPAVTFTCCCAIEALMHRRRIVTTWVAV
jgi:hypothetical protein